MIRRHYSWLLIIFLLAALLRLTNLGSKSVWLDEAFAVRHAARPVADIWQEQHDNHPVLYYLILHSWMAMGESETLIRLPSVFFSMIGLGLFYALARRSLESDEALLATALLAFSPLDLWYAQEARMVLFVVPPALLMALGITIHGRGRFLLVSLGLGLGLYFDYPIILIWAALSGVAIVSAGRGDRAKSDVATWLGGSLVGWLAFEPQWWHLRLVAGRMSDIFVIANLREAFNLPALGLVLFPMLVLIVGATSATGTWLLGDMFAKLGQRRAALHRLIVLLVTVGFVVLTLLTPIPRLYSVKRIVVTGWPFVILLVVWLVSQLRSEPALFRQLVFLLMGMSLIASMATLVAVPKDDWRGAVKYINQEAEAGDIVWLDPTFGSLPYNYYEPLIAPQSSRDLLSAPPKTGIWHIAERQPSKANPASEAEAWLNANRRLVSVRPFYRLEVRYYLP